MADEADFAGELSELMLSVALKNVGQFPPASLEYCEDCGSEIPMARRIAVNARLCIGCQEYAEASRRR